MLIWNFHKSSHNLKTLFDVFLREGFNNKKWQSMVFCQHEGGSTVGQQVIFFFFFFMKKNGLNVRRERIYMKKKKLKFQQKNLVQISFQQNF